MKAALVPYRAHELWFSQEQEEEVGELDLGPLATFRASPSCSGTLRHAAAAHPHAACRGRGAGRASLSASPFEGLHALSRCPALLRPHILHSE